MELLSWMLGLAIGDPLTILEVQTLVRFILLLGVVFATFVLWRLKAIVDGVNKVETKTAEVSEVAYYNKGRTDTLVSFARKKG